MSEPPASSLNAPLLLLNLTRAALERRQLLQLYKRKWGGGEEEEEEGGAYFVEYTPPARDAITLPRNVVYVLIGVVLVVVATYAIVGHLIKDLMHDLADWILGPKPAEDDSGEGGVDSGDGVEGGGVEKDAPLPGFHRGDGGGHHGASIPPPPPPPLPPPRSAMFPSNAREKRTSTQSVTFARDPPPYATSL